MTPKEKAKELVEKYRDVSIIFVDSIEGTCDMRMNNEDTKECALIAVEEVLFILPYTCNCEDIESSTWFYESVKQELENL